MKKISFIFLMILLIIASVEAMSYAVHLVVFGEPISISKYKESRIQIISRSGTVVSSNKKQPFANIWSIPGVPHPYSGYVRILGEQNPVNEYGFFGSGKHFYNDPDDFVVAITGGSVAEMLWLDSFKDEHSNLRNLLKKIPELSKKNIRFICLAMSSYKQPQQLSTVAYYLAQGGKLDVLINLDGFNEISKSRWMYNKGINYTYPWFWNFIMGDVNNTQKIKIIGKIDLLRSLRSTIAEYASKFSYSLTANFLWKLSDRYLEHKIFSQNAFILNKSKLVKNRSNHYTITGPKNKFKKEEVLKKSSNLWAQSSTQLNNLAKGNGFKYFHFLQPNQYFPGTKEFSDKERKIALSNAKVYKKNVLMGYNALRILGKNLRNQNVQYFDLTGIFKGIKEPVFIDACCHMNKKGNNIMMHEIGKIISDFYNKK